MSSYQATTSGAFLLVVVMLATSLPQTVFGGALFESPKPIFPSASAYKTTFKLATPANSIITLKVADTPVKDVILSLMAEFQPCAALAAHFHPRGTESVYVIAGAIEVGMILEDGTSRIVKAKAGEGVVIPQGTVHYVSNAGCSKAQILATLDSPAPGTVFVGPSLLSLPASYRNSAFTMSPPKGDSPAFFKVKGCTCKPTPNPYG